MKKSIIAIIPARSGSKRIPNKNILFLHGKPMIAWTIEAALASGIFDDVIVSTDSDEISSISKEYGAEVPFLRDHSFSDDYTPVSMATINALNNMEKYKKTKYDTVVQLMPNCPCRTKKDIIDAYSNFNKNDYNFQISVFKFGWMNPWWALQLDSKKDSPKKIFPEAHKKRSQDLESLYCPTGAVWIANGKTLKDAGTFYGRNFKIYPLSWQSAVDIDNQDDLEMAELVFMLRESRKNINC